MAQVNQIKKKGVMSRNEIIKFQIFTYCFLNNIVLSEADAECMLLLVTSNYTELHIFCKKACELKIFKTAQSVRNSLNKLEKKNILIKEGKNKKKIFINPSLELITEGNILLNYNFLSVEPNQI